MDQATHDFVAREVARYTDAAPAHWVRYVRWTARLYDEGSPAGAFQSVDRVLTWDGGQLGAEYLRGPAGALSPTTLDELVAGQPDEGWTLLRVEVDRDGSLRADLSDEPPLEVEDSATNPFWDDVRDYLPRHQDDLEALVGRLRDEGELPGEADVPSEPDPMSLPPSQRPRTTAQAEETPTRRGRFFGRR